MPRFSSQAELSLFAFLSTPQKHFPHFPHSAYFQPIPIIPLASRGSCFPAKHSHARQATITDFRGLFSTHDIITAGTLFMVLTGEHTDQAPTFILFKVDLKC